MNKTEQAYIDMQLDEGKLDNFDKAYNKYHETLKDLLKAFSKAATDKKAVGKMKTAIQALEDAIDDGNMKD